MQWLWPALVAGVALGVVLGDALRGSGSVSAPLWPWVVAAAFVGASWWWGLRSSRRSPWVILGACGVALGLGAHLSAADPALGAPAGWGRDAEAWSELEGVVEEGSRARLGGGWSAVVRADQCDGRPCSARLLLSAAEGAPVVGGDRVWAGGRAWRPREREARWLPDMWRWSARLRLAGGLSAEEPVVRLEGSATARGALDRWRQGREAWIEGALGQERAALVLAILTGTKGFISPERRAPIDEAGLSHLLAISGLHLSLLGGLVIAAVDRLGGRRARWASSAGGLAVVGVFAALVGWPVSAQRSFVMLVGWRVASALDRRGAMSTGIAVAAAVILLGDTTHALFDPGFQLSVSALAGLGAIFEGEEREASGALGWAVGTAKASVVCSAACAPWLMWHFGRLPLLGVGLNVPAIPLMMLSLISGLGALVFSAIPGLEGVAEGLLWVCWAGMWGIEAMAVEMPMSGIEVGLWPGPALVAVLIVAGALAARGKGRAALACLSAGVLAVGLWGGPSGPEVRFLPVGQGDSILLRDGRGAAVLVDAGGRGLEGQDAGEEVVRPGLLRLGVRRLDGVVISHADLDHIGGVASVVRRFRPRWIWWSAPDGRNALEAEVLEAARLVGARVMEPPARAQVGAMVFRRLDRGGGASRNDRSVVMEVEVEGLRVLLTGDIEAEGERLALPRVRPVHALKVAHHGSKTSSSLEFLRRARAPVAVIQAGAGNRFGHPVPEVVDRLRANGALVLDTIRCGGVVLRPEGGRLLVRAELDCGPAP